MGYRGRGRGGGRGGRGASRGGRGRGRGREREREESGGVHENEKRSGDQDSSFDSSGSKSQQQATYKKERGKQTSQLDPKARSFEFSGAKSAKPSAVLSGGRPGSEGQGQGKAQGQGPPGLKSKKKGKQAGRSRGEPKVDVFLEKQVETVRAILPDYGRGFIAACLKHYKMNLELTVSHVMEGSLPYELATLDSTQDIIMPAEGERELEHTNGGARKKGREQNKAPRETDMRRGNVHRKGNEDESGGRKKDNKRDGKKDGKSDGKREKKFDEKFGGNKGARKAVVEQKEESKASKIVDPAVVEDLAKLEVESTSYIRFQKQLGHFSLSDVSKSVPPNCTVLCVAEKPSLAQSIACFLAGGKGRVHTRRSAQDVHEFSAQFLGKQANFKVTSVIGHVYSLDFKLAKHQSWDIDPSELFDAPTERQEANPKAHICKHLKQEAKYCHFLLLWLDCDREGENICFEVIENTHQHMKKCGIKYPILRAKFSAITESAIKTAMQNLTLPNENEALAVDARQELDLKVGVSFTRFQTRYFQGKYSNLDASVVSYGPCQTPTLGFCVERHIERVQHVPKPFWTLSVEAKKSGEIFSLNPNSGRMFDQKKAQKLKNTLLANGEAQVVSVEEKKGSTQRPTGLNTVNMLKMASTALGMGPHHAMQVAERLYMQGFLSYPRTESTGYPNGFDMRGTLYAQTYNRYWGSYVQSLLDLGYTAPRPGKDMGDHPPITPMSSATENDIGGGDAWRLYDMVTRHFIASVSPDATHLTTKIVLQSGNETLTATGKRSLTPGFTAILSHASVDTSSVPALQKGDTVPFTDITVNQGETTPPAYLSESDLIEKMEKNGIGTDASIPTHINNICVRRYCNTDNSRHMVPTGLGIVLVQGYKLIDKDLVLPTVRSYIEKQIDDIAKGKISKQAVMRKSLQEFVSKFKHFVTEIEKMDALFEASFTNAESSGKIYTRCGKTMRYLKLINSRPPKLYNPLTEEIYVMPLGGAIKQYKSLTCPICNFELSLYSLGHKSFPLCPNCYCNPPEGMSEPEKGVCTTCPMDDTHPIIESLKVCDCPESDGVLMVDPVGGPNWKLISTRSPLIAQFPPGQINKLTVLAEEDENGQRMIMIDFHKNSTLLKDGSLKHKGSLSDPFVENLIEWKMHNERGMVGRRGRGRGRRGRGRGRGRGKKVEDLKMTFYGF